LYDKKTFWFLLIVLLVLFVSFLKKNMISNQIQTLENKKLMAVVIIVVVQCFFVCFLF